MTQAGGPAAINGFLYQILHHLSWISEVRLSGTLQRKVIKEALLVLEPRAGGDARVEAEGVFLVEQYKSRYGRTWSIAGLESVLIDLRKAVPAHFPKAPRYRFVTDGRPGRVDAFNSFLTRLRSAGSVHDLDDARAWTAATKVSMTDRKYLQHLVISTRAAAKSDEGAGKAVPDPVTPEEEAVVFHLLTHLECGYQSRADERAQEIEALLRGYTDNLGDEGKVRLHLVGLMMDRLSQGEARLDGAAMDALLQQAGVNPKRLRNVSNLPKSLNRLVANHLRRFQYRVEEDVRPAPQWPAAKPVLVIAGASGIGKSWQVARLLATLYGNGQPAILVVCSPSAESTLTQVAEVIWQQALGETSNKSLLAVSHFLRHLDSRQFWSSIVVAVDDVQDVDVARRLTRQDWPQLGMRLVISTSDAVATALRLSDSEVVHLHTVAEFTTDELEAYLIRNGRSWTELPGDLKRLLRNPILAGLYVRLPHASIERAPRSEYEIFQRFWQRIRARGGTGDDGVILALGARVLDAGQYPVPRSQWSSIGLESADAARLEATGWMRITDGSAVELAHDRLLNWAIARSLAIQFDRGELSTEQLFERLCGGVRSQQPQRTRLAYIPMDTLWLIAGNARHVAASADLLARMEAGGEFGPYGESLYSELVPTLGAPAVPMLLKRLESLPDDATAHYRAALIGSSFVALSGQEAIDLKPVIADLLASQSRLRQSVALAVLEKHPEAGHLDRLWTLHIERTRELNERVRERRSQDYEASFSALSSAIACDPEWLVRRVRSADAEREPVSELAYSLNVLESDAAPTIWQEVGDLLIAKVARDKPRGLLYCITRFRDRSRLDFVLQHLTSKEDFAAGAALGAMSMLDPALALERLDSVPDSVRELFRSHWLLPLLRREPQGTRRRLLQMARSRERGRRLIENVFAGRVDELGEELFEFELTALEADLRQNLAAAQVQEPMWLYGPLQFVGSVSDPLLLGRLQSRAGGSLEKMITQVAVSRLSQVSDSVDRVLEGVRRVLILIGGVGLTELLQEELKSNSYWVRHTGLLYAFMRPSEMVAEQLVAIATRAEPGLTDDVGRVELEFHSAACALAHIGPDRALLEVFSSIRESQVPFELARLRSYRGPIAPAVYSSAVAAVKDPQSEEWLLQRGLVVAWMSGDRDCMGEVRSALRQADPSGVTARYACIALTQLGDASGEFAALVARLLYTETNHLLAIDILLAIGPVGLEPLARWLRETQPTVRSEALDRVLRALHARSETRQLAIDTAVVCTMDSIAAESLDAGVRQSIVDRAFSTLQSVNETTALAIEGLARFDAPKAAQAISQALQRQTELERRLCYLSIQTLSPGSAAADMLISRAAALDRESLTQVVGQTLRVLAPADVEPSLIKHMQSGRRAERVIAAGIAAWIPSVPLARALEHLTDDDNEGEVRNAAFISLSLQRTLSNLQVSLANIPAATDSVRWALITSVMETANPYLLTMPGDPLYLEPVLSQLPYIFTRHAEYVIHNRKLRADRIATPLSAPDH